MLLECFCSHYKKLIADPVDSGLKYYKTKIKKELRESDLFLIFIISNKVISHECITKDHHWEFNN